MLKLITSPEDLPQVLAASVSAEEKKLIQKLKNSGLPFAVTPYFASLAGPEKSDPIRRQFMPDPLEAQENPFALDDPIGEAQYRITPRLVHQYRDRTLLLAGGICTGFCRYCFRRVRMSSPTSFINEEELKPVLAYLETQPGIREILISGGDPLTADDNELEKLFIKLRKARPDILIRLCSRVPITNPERVSPGTISLLSRYRPLRMVIHINHSKELAPACRSVLCNAVEAGIPVLVQTVLLRGINDNAETLAALFRECFNLGLSLYYLFQLDLAPGTAHFRVPLKEGISIYRELRQLFPDYRLPEYVVDLPGGGGKIRLCEEAIAGEEERPGGRVYLLKDKSRARRRIEPEAGPEFPSGKLWEYPAE